MAGRSCWYQYSPGQSLFISKNSINPNEPSSPTRNLINLMILILAITWVSLTTFRFHCKPCKHKYFLISFDVTIILQFMQNIKIVK